VKDALLLTETSKEELIEEILRLRKENEALKRKLGEKEQTELRKKFLKLQRLELRVLFGVKCLGSNLDI